VPAPSIDELNALPAPDAEAELAVLFESAPRFLARLAAERPFADEDDLFERAETIALELPEDEAVELVNAHPRLGAPAAEMSALSRREQGEPSTSDRLAPLNEAYERRFGFRYCVFVAGRPREALVPEWEARLESGDRDTELHRARRDVVAIARDRYRRLRAESASAGTREATA
jgi:2-oxo-4-hydroxy-4-carboxy--5-ureidoimidazoline (OHCU) decarboxylase